MLLLVAGLNATLGGFDPDLQKVQPVFLRVVELAVQYARACGHALHIAGAHHFAIAHVVLVLHLAIKHVGDNFHIPVGVGAKAVAGGHAVFVDHPQRAEAHVVGVHVIGERKRVVRAQPAVVCVAPLVGTTNLHEKHPITELCWRLLYDRVRVTWGEAFSMMLSK